MTDSVVTIGTDAGALALWCATTFADVDGYDAWETRVNERYPDAIAAGELVPVGIGGDGAFGVRAVVAPDGLSAREQEHAVVTSEPYLLVVTGDGACLSNLESVGDVDSAPVRLPLAPGRYAVRATIVDRESEPGMQTEDGSPADGALPDFVVAVAPADGTESFRWAEETFDPPG